MNEGGFSNDNFSRAFFLVQYLISFFLRHRLLFSVCCHIVENYLVGNGSQIGENTGCHIGENVCHLSHIGEKEITAPKSSIFLNNCQRLG